MKVAFATNLPPPFMLLIDSINNKLLKMPEYGLFSGDNEELEESNKHGFWYGMHVESIVLLSKLHTKQNIEVELEMSELDLAAAESKDVDVRIRKG